MTLGIYVLDRLWANEPKLCLGGPCRLPGTLLHAQMPPQSLAGAQRRREWRPVTTFTPFAEAHYKFQPFGAERTNSQHLEFIFTTDNLVTGHFKKNFCWVYCFLNVVLVSTVQQNKSAIPIHISPFFWVFFPFRSPESMEQRFPVLCSRFSLVICFVHSINSVYMSIQSPNSSHPPSPLVTMRLFSHLCLYFCFANEIVYSIFIPHLCVNI